MIGDTVLMCPFCRARLSAFPPQLCSGSFTDDDHPSGVPPVAVTLDQDDEPTPESEQAMATARDTHGRAPAA